MFSSVRKFITRPDVPPGSWILNAGGSVALGLAWLLRPLLTRSSTGALVPAALYTAGIALVAWDLFGPSASYYGWEAAGRPVHGVRRS